MNKTCISEGKETPTHEANSHPRHFLVAALRKKGMPKESARAQAKEPMSMQHGGQPKEQNDGPDSD